MTARTAFRVTCLLGFLAVALGAFGAHGLEGRLTERLLRGYQTGVLYQFFHVLAMLVATRMRPFPFAAWLSFLTGVVLFSGSLYVLALTGILWLGAITPFGGVAFLAGWLLLGWAKWEG